MGHIGLIRLICLICLICLIGLSVGGCATGGVKRPDEPTWSWLCSMNYTNDPVMVYLYSPGYYNGLGASAFTDEIIRPEGEQIRRSMSWDNTGLLSVLKDAWRDMIDAGKQAWKGVK